MNAAATLAELLAAGVQVEASGDRVRLREPRPGLLRPEHAPAVRSLKLPLRHLALAAWRPALATWPDWRRYAFEERAAIREYDGRQARDLAERCAYLEAAELPEEPAPLVAPPLSVPPVNDCAEALAADLEGYASAAPTLALLLEAWPGARVEGRRRPAAPAVDLEEPATDPAEAPPGFVHRYRPPPDRPALPPFRWSALPPATRRVPDPGSFDGGQGVPTPPPAIRRPLPPPTPAPPPATATPHEPPAGPMQGPRELPELRAARCGYRIDAFGSWLETGEASRAPFRGRFAVGREPSTAELEAHRAQLAAIEADGLAVLGPLRGASPLPEPSPDVLPERAATWREAYQRRLGAGLDPESAARLTITTHGPRPA